MSLTVAILGAGIGAEHLAAYRSLPDLFEVVLIVDRDVERARAMAGGIPVAEELDAALAAGVDLIDICLPPHLHVPVALKAMEAGAHVICEKPIATSLADADRLASALDASGRTMFPVFQYRFGPAMRALKALDTDGLLGQPVAASLVTHWNRGADYYTVPWRGTWGGEEGGAILGHAIHAHDLLAHLFGPVAAVAASLATRVNPIETDDTAAISFEMSSGALATSSVTLGGADDHSRLRLVFEHLTAESDTVPYAPMTGAWTFTARDPSQQRLVDGIVRSSAEGPNGFAGFLTEISHVLAGVPGAAPVTLAEARLSIEIVTAIYQSARSGVRVALPLPDDHPLYDGWRPKETF